MHTTLSDGDGRPDATDPGGSWPAPEHDRGGPGRVVGGVAALLGDRLGLNPFWLRMAFVVLALAGGLGVVVYVGLWLILVAAEALDRVLLRVVGGAVIAAGAAYLLGNGRTHFVTGTPAVVAVLLGLALALWQPRLAVSVAPRPTTTSASTPGDAAPHVPRQRRPRREPSVLGRATLGLAVVVAAGGALIDQVNGGRLHPEQWLGAGAAVCGAGMLVGVVRGRARWLILPAAIFAATGYVGGAAAERGISLRDRGTRYIDVSSNSADEDASVSFGSVDLGIFEAPTPSQRRKVDVLVGDVRISVGSAASTSIDLHWDVAHGSVTIGGVRQPRRGATHLGPARVADVVVDVSIWRGDLTLWTQPPPMSVGSSDGSTVTTLAPVEPPPTVPGSPDVAPVIVTDGVTATTDGYFLLGDGEAMIDDTDHLLVGTSLLQADGVTEISTSRGQFRLLPRGILLTPTNEVVDLHAWRTRLAPASTTTVTTASTAAPDTTAPATSVPATLVPDDVVTTTAVSTTAVPTSSIAG